MKNLVSLNYNDHVILCVCVCFLAHPLLLSRSLFLSISTPPPPSLSLSLSPLFVAPSTETLAKVAAIRESSMQYLEQLSDSEEEEEEEEGQGRPGHSQLLEKTLSMYYSNFESGTDEISEWPIRLSESHGLSICNRIIALVDQRDKTFSQESSLWQPPPAWSVCLQSRGSML